MLVLLFLLTTSTVIANNVIHIQYFRRPEEYGVFHFHFGNGTKGWESFIYMNKSVNLREEEIYKIVKPFFEEAPSTRRYESSSITRHLGKQFEYVLNRYPVHEIIFENLCSQMKPKFSALLTSIPSQTPQKIKWIIEHPSAFFLVPYGFTKRVGREEYRLEIKGRASLDEDNFDYDALQNTQKLIIKNESHMKNGVTGEHLLKIKAPEVLIEGWNAVTSDDLNQFAKEWLNGDREIKKWIVHLADKPQAEQLYFEKNETTLDILLKNNRFEMTTYKTPEDRKYQFSTVREDSGSGSQNQHKFFP
ncbi:Protein CBG04446 [Caenorhabditis briggsae]|uniref:F-box associated domain-containing protein n=2 Tax=Caenorhabditis briggsae TaxID=6238 RepID=A0AAE9AH15_CAEBR|nr:Protein CBG04446 [Caenorhabditis briggsae]ULT97024.1 hypothetical protein L3Y34_005084 [Caenorhabditis briggsae]CAP25144.2 Protein CBG04446 [Caenorhabditis briggsae]